MYDEPNAPPAARVALVVLGSARGWDIWRELRQAGWIITPITSCRALAGFEPAGIDCLLLDSACQPLVDEILVWCEKSGLWRNVSKVLVLPAATDYANLAQTPVQGLQEKLNACRRPAPPSTASTMAIPAVTDSGAFRTGGSGTQVMFRVSTQVVDSSDRRRHYRHPCNQPVIIQLRGTLVDLSVGGMALEMPCALPKGVRLHVSINEHDPLLKMVEAEIVSSEPRRENVFCAHAQFVNVTPSIERSLQRYLLALQMAKGGEPRPSRVRM